MKKRMISLVLFLLLACCLVPAVHAEGGAPEAAANVLHELGLFQGTGTDASGKPIYSLEKPMTREEAITMLVRLLGKEEKACAAVQATPFTDVSDWAKPYVGYAYANGLTQGTGETTFGGKETVTASQYITMVLRALGYADGTDFVWNASWTFSDQLGLTDGSYGVDNDAAFIRGDAAVVSHSALQISPRGKNTTLLDRILKTEPVDLAERRLSDAQLAQLDGKPPVELKEAISTVADARAFLNRRYPKLMHSGHSFWKEDGCLQLFLRSGEELLKSNSTVGRSDMITIMAYLLEDDCTIHGLYGFQAKRDQIAPITAINYVRSGKEYIFFDPVRGMDADFACRRTELFPEMTVGSVEEYIEKLRPDMGRYSVDVIYDVDRGQALRGILRNGWVTIQQPEGRPIYANEENHLTDEEYEEKKYGHIKVENIGRYRLPTMLGGLTLTQEDAKALVGAEPAVLKEKVKTAGDLLEYMLASRLLLKNGDEQIVLDGERWHYNSSAAQTLKENLGNCGRMANVANYLLEGDYEEVGYILHSYYPGKGGGHVYNYIKDQGIYYIVDFSSYLFSNYSISREHPVLAMDKLEDYGTRWRECCSDLATVIAHTSTGKHLPNVWRGDGVYFPEGAEFQVLYETPGTGYEVRTLPLDTTRLDWHSFD